MHLERILKTTRASVADRKSRVPLRDLERRAGEHTPRGFARALRSRSGYAPAIIAELKKASPSKGLIRPDFEVPSLAKSLERGGASCLSVLTEERFFQGSLQNLESAEAAGDRYPTAPYMTPGAWASVDRAGSQPSRPTSKGAPRGTSAASYFRILRK